MTTLRVLNGHKECEKVWLCNEGNNTIFYGPSKQNVEGKVDAGYKRLIPSNYVFWCSVGVVNARIRNRDEVS